jgi:IclR family pca regulon transcriptional regulator
MTLKSLSPQDLRYSVCRSHVTVVVMSVERPDSTSSSGEEWSTPTLREPRFSQSLERGLAILQSFTPARPVLGIAEIAKDLGMSRSTTYRYVITLVALGYVEQATAHKYRLGLGVTELGMSALSSTSLREHSHLSLEELRRRCSYTVNLAVLDGPDILYVTRCRSLRRGQRKIDLDLAPGARLPAYCTAMGKLLLSYLSEQELAMQLSESTLAPRGPNTITTKKALRAELEHVREEHFAVNDQELLVGLHSISAPVRSEGGDVVAAINMAAHVSMIGLDELVEDLGPHLKATAGRISARLGYRRDDENSATRAHSTR